MVQVKAFATAAGGGEYYDDQAAEYFGEDPADRDYNVGRGYIDEYDIVYHKGMSTLKKLLEDAGSYYQAGIIDPIGGKHCIEVSATAYEQLLGVILPDRGYDLFANHRFGA